MLLVTITMSAQSTINIHKAEGMMFTQVTIELDNYENAIKLAVGRIPARTDVDLTVNGTWYSIYYSNSTYHVSYTDMAEEDSVPELIYESTRIADTRVWILNHIIGQEL